MEQKRRIEEDLVQKDEECSDCLTRPLFDVNMRLFGSNRSYRTIIIGICDYMERVINREYTNYAKLAGLSGANVGIPCNIISIRKENRTLTMINPVITKMSKTVKELESNCGSLNLSKPFPVNRRKWVDVSYYDTAGKHHEQRFAIPDGGGTIQHEIDHNRGVLITDTAKHL